MLVKKILLFGPRYNIDDLENIGGVIVLFEDLLTYLDTMHINYIVIDTNKSNYSNLLVSYLSILFGAIVNIRKVTYVSIHGTSSDYLFIVPIILLMSRILNKYFSLRKFGGNFNSLYEEYSILGKFIVRMILRYSKCNFFETKYLVQYFSKYNKNTFWFPNVRVRILYPSLPRKYIKRFVFISHVRKSKGIDEILEASQKLNDSFVIDIYGPIVKDYTEESFLKYHNVTYKGALASSEVINKLNEYDVLLLPSYQEGYPGIIIEAFSLGIPVISTNIAAICEIVDNYKNGILVPPKNILKLIDAMNYFNKENYEIMSTNAYMSFDAFDSSKITKGFINEISDC